MRSAAASWRCVAVGSRDRSSSRNQNRLRFSSLSSFSSAPLPPSPPFSPRLAPPFPPPFAPPSLPLRLPPSPHLWRPRGTCSGSPAHRRTQPPHPPAPFPCAPSDTAAAPVLPDPLPLQILSTSSRPPHPAHRGRSIPLRSRADERGSNGPAQGRSRGEKGRARMSLPTPCHGRKPRAQPPSPAL